MNVEYVYEISISPQCWFKFPALLTRKLKIQKTNIVLYDIEPDLPSREQGKYYKCQEN